MRKLKIILCFSQCTDLISEWKFKRLSYESIKFPATSNNSLALALNYNAVKTRVKFDQNCLKADKIIFTYRETIKIYIVYEKV